MQVMLMGVEKDFKIELENAKKNFEEEKRRIEERYKKIIAERVEDYKEKTLLLYERIDELKNEKSENEDKLRVYDEKFNELNDRVSRLVEEMGGINEVEFNSAENCSGKSRNEGIDNINLVPTEKSSPGDQSFQYVPSVCASAKVDSNCNEQKESDHFDETDPIPIKLASECGDPTTHPSACKAVDCSKNNLNAASDKPESSPVMIISDSDDEMTTNEMACASNRCGLGVNLACCPLKKEMDVQESSYSTQKRKRSTSEGENSDGYSFGRQKKVLIPELVNDGNMSFVGDNSSNPERSSKVALVVSCPDKNSAFIRRCEDKVGVENHSELPPRRSDKPQVFSKGNDSDSDNDSYSTRKMDMFIKDGRKWLSEDDLCSAFEKDPELCMNAVCALYRQQTENKSSYSMSQIDEMSITGLGVYLIDGDPENKLRRTMSEVSPKDHGRCKILAIRYCHQIFQIYHSKKDRLFCPRARVL